MSLSGTAGLRLDQAPPLAVPAAFFLTGPLALVAAGGVLLLGGDAALATPWAGRTLALTHLGTLGLLAATMVGALYQMLPVVAGVPVPAVRLAHAVHALLVAGVAALVAGFGGAPTAAGVGAVALSAAFTLFLVPVAVALFRAPASTGTVWGMRLAVASLAVAATLGVRMALGHAGLGWAAPRNLWIEVHLVVALLGWVGGLLTAVSWQVVPMFYLAPNFPETRARAVAGAIALGVVGPLAVLGATTAGAIDPLAAPRLAAAAALPAAVAVWLVHPALVLRGLANRRRKLVDGSVRFWRLGMVAAPFVFALGVAAVLGDDPRWGLAFAWTAVWGWAGAVVHGMLGRIVPFLVWFHRFSPLVGRVPVPAMRQLWPEGRLRVGLALHVAALATGLVAIATGSGVAAQATGGLLAATGLHLFGCLALVLVARPKAVAVF